MTTTHFVLVDDDLTNSQMQRLSGELEKVGGITQVLSYEKFLGGGIPEEMVPQDVQNIFHAGKRMLLANSSYKSGSDEQNAQLNEMNRIVKSFDPQGKISGEGAMTKRLD